MAGRNEAEINKCAQTANVGHVGREDEDWKAARRYCKGFHVENKTESYKKHGWWQRAEVRPWQDYRRRGWRKDTRNPLLIELKVE